MSDRLLIRAISGAGDGYEPFVLATEGLYHAYAKHCGADYLCFVGKRDPHMTRDEGVLHASWNRVPLILEAFTSGYRQVVWMDADTLVIDLKPGNNVFDAHDDGVPFHTIRVPRMNGDGWMENDGVIVAANTPEARAAYEQFWTDRHAPIPGWQQGHYDAYVGEHPEIHGPLDPIYNWFDWGGNIQTSINRDYPPRAAAHVLAWHAWDAGIQGSRHEAMFRAFEQYWPAGDRRGYRTG